VLPGSEGEGLATAPSPQSRPKPKAMSKSKSFSHLYANMYSKASQNTRASLDHLEEHVPSIIKVMVGHPAFSLVCLMAILANTIFIGVHAEFTVEAMIEGAPKDTTRAFNVLEILFCAFFTIELILRFAAGPKSFVMGEDHESQKWNFFDTVLVLTCLADIILQQVQNTKGLNYVRILRILRLARVLRIIRVIRFFRSLRLMVYSIIHSMVSLLWVFLLLLSAMYVFSIFFLHSVMEHFKSHHPSDSPPLLLESFGTVMRSMISLFMAICGGRDWHEYYEVLGQISWFVSLLFLFYIFFVVFGVLNVVTGAFVDSMRLVSEKDRDTVVDAEMKKVDTFRKDVTKMFLDADMDDSGTLSWEEFEAHLQDDRVNAFFQSLQIDTSQARALFVLLDIEESDEVPIQKFVEGCMRMRGDAKSIDVNMLLYKSEKMIGKITNFCELCEDKFELMERELCRIDAVLGIQAPQRNGRRGGVCFDGNDTQSGSSRPSRRNSRDRARAAKERAAANAGSMATLEPSQDVPRSAAGAVASLLLASTPHADEGEALPNLPGSSGVS